MKTGLILLYHSISDSIIDPTLQISPNTLCQHITWIRQLGGKIVSLHTLCKKLVDEREFPESEHWVAITFDDGYKDFYDLGYNLLVQLGIQDITLFMCPQHVGKDNSWNYRIKFCQEHLQIHHLKELQEKGIHIEAHGFSHRNFFQFDAHGLQVELEQCKQWFRRELCQETRMIAYPFGDYKEEHLPYIGNAFQYGFSVKQGRGFSDPRAISRVCVGERTTFHDFTQWLLS